MNTIVFWSILLYRSSSEEASHIWEINNYEKYGDRMSKNNVVGRLKLKIFILRSWSAPRKRKRKVLRRFWSFN